MLPRLSSIIHHRFQSTVAVLLEANASGKLAAANKNVIAAASQLSQSIHGIAFTDGIADEARSVGCTEVIRLRCIGDLRLAETICQTLAELDRDLKPTTWMAGHTAFGKNVMPRLAGTLAIPCISDVIRFIANPEKTELVMQRPIYAGNAIATVKCAAPRRIITIRPTAFHPLEKRADCAVRAVEVKAHTPVAISEYIGMEASQADARPELTSARIVIAGGRAFQSRAEFDAVLGALADAISGAAIGASRAAVDAGLAPNDLQVGQTGKVVAPALYIAVGISGAIQHVAGMKDSRMIVAINKDADAPIFQIADYGLVGDIKAIIPELANKLRGVHECRAQ